jgi:hypothetical protein
MSGPQIAARLEALALADAAEVLVLLQPVFNDLRRQAGLALERASDGGVSSR